MIGGVHRRTSPGVKDVFAWSQFSGQGLGDAWNLPVALHQLDQTELDGFRRFAFNYENAGFGGNIPGHFFGTRLNGDTSEQLAIAVYDDLMVNPNSAAVGVTDAQRYDNQPVLGPPWTIGVGASTVFSARIRTLSPPESSETTVNEPYDTAKLRQTIAHEIGHNLALDDQPRPMNSTCPPFADTVMVTLYFTDRNPGSQPDCPWSNIPNVFNAADLTRVWVR